MEEGRFEDGANGVPGTQATGQTIAELETQVAQLTSERDDWARKAMEWRRKYSELRYPGMTNKVHVAGVATGGVAHR